MRRRKYELGLVGLGVMGRNLLLNMSDHQYAVVGFDKDHSKIKTLSIEGAGRDIRGTKNIKEFLNHLKTPRAIVILVPAGPAVDDVIRELLPSLVEKDIIIDCGNSHFTDTNLRQKTLTRAGIEFLGVGISGGEHGARHGPSIMPGGHRYAYERVRPVFEAVAARVKGEPCVTYLGPGSAGHFVKMVHNGIEYGLMEAIAETYDLMKRAIGLNDDDLADVYERWNDRSFHSYLLEITAHIFCRTDEKTGNRLIDVILDEARQKGTGKWTSQAAMDLQVPVPVVDAAVATRDISGYKKERETASAILKGPPISFRGKNKIFIDSLEKALHAVFMIVYSQGMALLRKASDAYGYELNLADVARIWRGGCIIRAAMLEDIRSCYEKRPELPNLLLDVSFGQNVADNQHELRGTVCAAANMGIPVPVMMAALTYYDSYRSAWMPTSLIQAQRDYFGAHTYERIDEKGV
ncbi:MAG TPA: NADP-dependent phosphogluconate dehydrogenase, partial [Syntrophales bacterium]|nr:NADP-dependent phosphogluconate dehydrogenase [Syntrophales bacterium]